MRIVIFIQFYYLQLTISQLVKSLTIAMSRSPPQNIHFCWLKSLVAAVAITEAAVARSGSNLKMFGLPSCFGYKVSAPLDRTLAGTACNWWLHLYPGMSCSPWLHLYSSMSSNPWLHLYYSMACNPWLHLYPHSSLPELNYASHNTSFLSTLWPESRCRTRVFSYGALNWEDHICTLSILYNTNNSKFLNFNNISLGIYKI